MSPTASTAGAVPRSPWAKFTTLLSRKVSPKPSAMSEPRSPRTAPWTQTPKGMGKRISWTASTAATETIPAMISLRC